MTLITKNGANAYGVACDARFMSETIQVYLYHYLYCLKSFVLFLIINLNLINLLYTLNICKIEEMQRVDLHISLIFLIICYVANYDKMTFI